MTKLSPLPAQVLADRDALGLERFAQHGHAGVRIGAAAHEDVDRGVMRFRPGVDRDVALGQHRYPCHTAMGRDMVQMNVQEGRSRHLNALLQRVADVPKIVQAPGAEQVDDEVCACSPDPISLDKVVFPVLSLR